MPRPRRPTEVELCRFKILRVANQPSLVKADRLLVLLGVTMSGSHLLLNARTNHLDMLGALYRMFKVKKIVKKLTHKEFPFLISCWKMLPETVDSGPLCTVSGSGGSRRRVEPSGPEAPSKSRHAVADRAWPRLCGAR